MKTKFINALIFSIAFVFAFTFTKAQNPQQLVHFWDFNNTLPAAGSGGDSLGTPYSYLNTRAIDSAHKSMTLYADYTKIPSGNPMIIAIRPKAIQNHCKLHDSIVDNGNGGATYYSYNGYNYNYFNTSDSVNGNNFVRYRNPSMNAYMYFVAPTTGYKNIHFSFAITASSSKGARYNVFQYSNDGGVTWDSTFSPIAVDTFTNARWATWKHDTLVVTNPNAPFKSQGVNNSLWEPVSIDLSVAVGVANNPQFMIRIRECAPTLAGTDSSARGISGNDRYDNFAITGDSNTPNIVSYIVRRQNVGPCYGDSNGSARAYVTGGTLPYTFSWSNNATNSGAAGGLLTDSAYGLKAGTYTLTVTDFNDNAAYAIVTILQPTKVVPALTATTNVSCNGSSTGAVNTITGGGTSPYTYSWSNGKTTANLTGLSAGSYTLTVTDHLGCVGTVSVSVTQPTVITIGTSSTPVTCAGPGTATATPSGGTPHKVGNAYQYSWSSGATTATATGLGAGSYTVTVSDSLGCSETASVNVTSSSITVSVSPTGEVICNGGNNGAIISTVSGGISPYTYNWSNGATTTAITGLTAGSYTLTITDHVGCNGSGTCTITQPAVLKDTIVSVTPATKLIHYWDFNQTQPIGGAGGDSLGTATYPLPADFTTLHSLNPRIVYSHPLTSGILDNGSGIPAAYINDLHVNGNDTASQAINNTFVRDRNPTSGASFIWYIPTTGYQNIALDWALSASSVKGAQYLIFSYSTNGGATWNKLTAANDTFTIGGGVHHPDSMLAINSVTKNSLWFPAHIDLSNIAAANNNPNLVFKVNYGGSNITLTSGNDRWDNISVKGQEIPTVSCNGNGNGSARSLVTGGTGPFTYSWSTGSTTDTVNNLVPGVNTVLVTDAHGCSTTASVNVVNPPVLKDSVVVNNGCNNSNNGIATSIPSGGTGPYNWSWSNGRNTNIDTNLAPGTYTITVTDNHGCTVTTTATITNPAVLLPNVISTSISCNGAHDGTASSAPSGGTSPYKYLWTPGNSTSSTITGLSPGTDTIKVTDKDGCTATAVVSISQPAPLTVSIPSSTPVGCNGGNSGSATASSAGGTSPYNYSWSNSATGATASNLTAGSYTVTATDNHGCTATASVTITEPTILGASILSSTAASCNGGGNGTATAGGTGGTSPYSFTWSNSDVGATVTNLTAGSYTVTVTDNNGCTATASVTITEPTSLTSSISTSTPVSCNGGNNGSASASAGGGTSPYTFTWSNSATGVTANNLTAGGYTVTVTDNNGCVSTASVTITEPTLLNASIASSTPDSCNGNGNGTATASASGGTSPYSFTWSNSDVGASVSSLTAGSYTVTVSDNNGCSATASVTITEPSTLNASIASSLPVSCNGGNNGSATATASGGTSPYTFNWSNSDVGATASSLTAGSYTVTVTDNNGCSGTASVSITEPNLLTTSMSFTQTTCTGAIGTATTSPSGGTPAYTYAWNNGGTTANITGLTSGTYSVVITDMNSCSVTASVLVTAAGGPRDSISAQTNISCFGGNNGSATVGVKGGVSPYTYSWTNAQVNPTATGLSAGSYTVTITDAGGCQTNAIAVITEPAQLRDSTINIIDEACFFNNTGKATVGVKGGTGPYTYAWSNGATSSTASGLFAGTYTITVTDSHGCSATATATITQPTQVRDSVTALFEGCVGHSNGNATISTGGGTSPYTYSWSTIPVQTSASATGLSAGTYTITITDAHGCTLFTNVTINPDSIPTVTFKLGKDSVICDTVKNLALASFGSPSGGTFSGTTVAAGVFHPHTAGNGTYMLTYVYTNGGGCSDSAKAKIRVDSCKSQGIPEIDLGGNKVTIYPNPTYGQFNISGLTIGSIIELYDDIGKLILTAKADKETVTLSIAEKSNGIYMVRIISKDGTSAVQQKVMKLH
jgi:hypothetical protein